MGSMLTGGMKLTGLLLAGSLLAGAADKATLSLDRWERHVIDAARPARAVFITAADLDGDGRKDILAGGWWYRNPGTPDGTWTRSEFGTPLRNMALVHDFNGDGRPDVLGTTGAGSSISGEFVWARNDGAGKFTVFNASECHGDFLQGAAIARFHKGDPLTILLAWHHGKLGQVGLQQMTVPSNPEQADWGCTKISDFSKEEELTLGDIDRDGKLDVLLGTHWLRNAGPGKWTPHTIVDTKEWGDRNRLVDINRDGRLDAVVGYWAQTGDTKLAWYEQPTDATKPWTEHVILMMMRPMSIDTADLDKDGDMDIVAGEHNLKQPEQSRLIVFENADGRGGKWTQHLVYTGDEHHDGAQLVDIDNDGDLDVISIGWSHPRVVLYENKAVDRRAGH
jgi:hypothetical protein